MKRLLLGFVLPITIVAAAGLVAADLLNSAESAERDPPQVVAPLVDYATVEAFEAPIRVRGTGVVEPAREVTISPEVSGKLVGVSDSLTLGGRVNKGAVLARVDKRAYALTVRERRTQVQQAELELELEGSRGVVARREWDLLAKTSPNRKRNPLALREPQKKAAEVAVESAKAALERAQYDQSRTVLRAPFNATITEESAELGQYVAPGTVVARLIGTDAFRVRVALPVEDLAHIEVPGLHGKGGSEATVRQSAGATQVERSGRVVRLLSEIDAESRTAQVLVEVKRPLDPPPGELPLLPGAFVNVEIGGRSVPDAVAVPRVAVDQGEYVWVIDENDALQRKRLVVAWKTVDTIVATAGVEPGQRVLTTDLPVPVDNMKVRTQAPGPAQVANAGSGVADVH